MPSTPIEALLDVNVIIASVFADHVMHRSARLFVQSLVRFYTTPTVQGGFLRFATRPLKNQVANQLQPRLPMGTAQATLRELTETPSHMFLIDDEPFTNLPMRSMQGHRQWTDAYLLHIARKHGISLASLESRMAILDDPKAPLLFVIT